MEKKHTHKNHAYAQASRIHNKHHCDFDSKKVMRKVSSRKTLKIHEVNKYQAVNFESDAKHVSPEFYKLIKRSTKPRGYEPKTRLQWKSERGSDIRRKHLTERSMTNESKQTNC